MDSYGSNETVTDEVEAVDVYVRSRCVSCRLLLSRLRRAGLTIRVHDILQDEASRAVVRAWNRGAETVPTVVVGRDVFTRPPSRWLIHMIDARHPDLITTRTTDTNWRSSRHRASPR
jgi:glutaredoxin